jgi:hypothetical protein
VIHRAAGDGHREFAHRGTAACPRAAARAEPRDGMRAVGQFGWQDAWTRHFGNGPERRGDALTAAG